MDGGHQDAAKAGIVSTLQEVVVPLGQGEGGWASAFCGESNKRLYGRRIKGITQILTHPGHLQ